AELAKAEIVFEGQKKDVAVWTSVIMRPEGQYPLLSRSINFYESEDYLLRPDGSKARLRFPRDASFGGFFKGYALATLRSDWNRPDGVIRRGSLVAVQEENILGKSEPRASKIRVLFKPDKRSAISGVSDTRDSLLVDTLSNIRSRTLMLTESSGTWTTREIPELSGGVSHVYYADTFSDTFTADYNDFLTPTSFFIGNVSSSEPPQKVKELAPRFDASTLVLEQGSALSRDGTSIPYFIVRPKALVYNGGAPALLYGYGGFERSMLPAYSAAVGKLWLEQGGVYVLANIRGGGEFGPEWHKAALRENRQKAFDDFLAVAQSLVSKKITSPNKLGIMGGSNGGLLMGAAFTQRPDLFGAVVCQVPLLDMLRYHKLLAGASWMAEYGDPDSKSMRSVIEAYSPYQNIRSGVKYPPIFFVTSSKDDRVHPGHARKSAAKLMEYGNDVFYFENIDGGHGASANNKELARRMALEYSFLKSELNP
ncbi:MAG TPA: prolyl oligopeptidase family serine peptidase, partial [Elusimicrobiales bacterium]|nr:prolyl oligopeptidase family serine peptidase [Elusimicrobiales bacterium]